MKNFGLLLIAIGLNSCMIGNIYKEPINGPIAQITFSTTDNISQVVDVVRYTGDEYLEHKGEALAWLSESEVNFKGKSVTVKVPAGKEFRFSIRHSAAGASSKPGRIIEVTNYFCINHVGFVPVEHGKYKVKSEVHANGTCSLRVENDGSGSSAPINSLRRYRSCIDPKLAGNLFKESRCDESFDFRA